LLEDIPVKLIKPAFEKSDLIHHIRLTLAMTSESEIKTYISENCKGTGIDERIIDVPSIIGSPCSFPLNRAKCSGF
jgi:hypothetical protein